jgi:hypothetical protein
MSAYNPPTENVPIFDSSLFRQENTDGTLTIPIADKRYLRFPIGQGQETIPSLVVQGQTKTNTLLIETSETFPDNTTQTTAYTGAKALAGSYTNTNMTIDANGKITALANGSAGTNQFQPTFNNASVLQVIGTNYGYTALQYINFTGGWGINDYICFRITCAMTWSNYGAGQYSNFATQNGLMYIYPYAMPGGVFSGANAGTQTIIWGNNTGSYSGWGNGKICNFVSNGSAGNCGYMTFYGSGTQNGGSLQFFFPNPGSTFNVSLAIEYLYRTGSGGGHTITNGSSYGQPYYYNSLP